MHCRPQKHPLHMYFHFKALFHLNLEVGMHPFDVLGVESLALARLISNFRFFRVSFRLRVRAFSVCVSPCAFKSTSDFLCSCLISNPSPSWRMGLKGFYACGWEWPRNWSKCLATARPPRQWFQAWRLKGPKGATCQSQNLEDKVAN